MSGSGGGRDDGFPSVPSARPTGGGGTGGGAGGNEDPCAIIQMAPLNSPRPVIVNTLAVGDSLEISLNESSGRPVIEVVSGAGVAGALTHTGHVKLIDCIRQGRSYVAIVISKSGGAVDLQVQPA